MRNNEMWQLYAPNGEAIPGRGRDASLGNPGEDEDDIVGGVGTFLYRRNGGTLEFLWQQRSKLVRRNAGKWDFSAAGHVDLGESFAEAAVRELREELGVEVSTADLEFIAKFRNYKGMVTVNYLLEWDGRGENLTLDPREVARVDWVPYVKMEEFWRNNAKIPMNTSTETLEALKKWAKRNYPEMADRD